METFTLPYLPRPYSTIHLALFNEVTNAPEIRKRLIDASIMEGEEGDKARAEVDYGFVEADLLVSKEHLLTATLTAILTAFPSSSSSSSSISSSSSSSSPGPTPNIENLSLSSSTSTSSSQNSSTTSTSTSTSTTREGLPTSTQTLTPKTRSHNLHSELLLYLSPNNNISDSIRRHGMSNSTKRLAVVHISAPEKSVEEVWKGIEGVVRGQLVSWETLSQGTDWARVDKIYKLSELNALKDPDVTEKKINAVISTVAIKNVV